MWTLTRVLLLSIGFFWATFSAIAEWRSDIGVFRIGVVTQEQSSSFVRRAEPFRSALQDALRMDVEFFTAKQPENIVDALSADRIEYAILSASGYALAWAVCECVEPIASPRSADGTDGYNLVLVAQPDGPKTLKELAGKKVGLLSSEQSLDVGIFKQALEKQGLKKDDTEFASEASGEAALSSFLDGKYQALLGWSSLTGDPSAGYTRGTLQLIARRTGDLATRYPIVWKSDQLGHRVHGARKKLPGEVKQILRDVLVTLYKKNPVAYDSIESIYGGGFTLTSHDRYQPFVDVIQSFQPQKIEEIQLTPEITADQKKQQNPPQ